ncbi:MAG: hypothetical protein NXI20_05490 [bacterium]|nr:hypothetical protein [bacterium]
MKKNLKFIILLVLVGVLAFRIISENSEDSLKEEYSYEEFLKSDKDRYNTFRQEIINEVKNRFYLKGASKLDNTYNHQLEMTSNQFEGPQVHLQEFVYNKKSYQRDSVQKYIRTTAEQSKGFNQFDIHSISFDPDHPQLYKPDIHVQVIPPKPYVEQRPANLQKFFDYIDGSSNEIKPYKTYTKEVFTINDDTTISVENINMDLWLTTFTVTVESDSYTKKIRLDEEDAELEKAGNKEYQNQRHKPFSIILKIFPNVSPWYVNNGNSFDKKADMAIGAIYCSKIKKWPKEDTDIGVIPRESGVALPLINQDYYLKVTSDEVLDLENNDKTIWNKPVYAEITFTDFGSWTKKWGIERGDEKISFDFIMPLFVRGSWDIQIPTEVIPSYKPIPPYSRKLSDILLPKWGLKGIGKFLSTILYVVIGFILLMAFFPMIPSMLIKTLRNIFKSAS